VQCQLPSVKGSTVLLPNGHNSPTASGSAMWAWDRASGGGAHSGRGQLDILDLLKHRVHTTTCKVETPAGLQLHCFVI
jgi:hypothetical protein